VARHRRLDERRQFPIQAAAGVAQAILAAGRYKNAIASETRPLNAGGALSLSELVVTMPHLRATLHACFHSDMGTN